MNINNNYNIQSSKEDFYSWFVGFSEGDGSFFSIKEEKAIRFEIWQSRMDKNLLEYIQSELGFGYIRYPKYRKDMAIFTVSKVADLKKLESIFISRKNKSF